jgi:hypothetical protein
MAMGKLIFTAAMKANRKRKLYACSVLIVCMIGTLWLNLKKPTQDRIAKPQLLTQATPYFVPLKIDRFSSEDIPHLKMEIEDKIVDVALDIGYDGIISLPADIIKDLKTKKFIRRKRAFGCRGKTYESDFYEVAKAHIEHMSFYPVFVEETNPEFEYDAHLAGEKTLENFGRIGWDLFRNFNLLIDCEHSKIALCDGLETLKKQGYPVVSFIEIPLLLDRGLIEFEAETEKGVLRCMLDTGATWNMLNKDLDHPESNNHMIFTLRDGDQSSLNPENKDLLKYDPNDDEQVFSSFKIGGKKFGPIAFDRIKSPMAIDAIIGMEFVRSTLIFIDFFNKKIYFLKNSPEKKDVADLLPAT